MATEAPSWADQWGAGGFGAMADDGATAKQEAGNNKKQTSGGLSKAKSVAQKLKNGTSLSFKWVRNKCQKKDPSK